jgi:exodeoxyribonuclease V beta subunit
MTNAETMTVTSRQMTVFDPWTFPFAGWSAVEASAGTGKTYNIVSVVVRLISEGIPLSQILVVTFTNAATSELRLRIRKGIVQARELLLRVWRDPAKVDATPEQRQFERLLETLCTDGVPDLAQVQQAIERLGQALQDIDSAPIMTMHSFASRTLREDALRAGSEFNLEIITDLSRYVTRISNDWMADIVVLPDSPARSWILQQPDLDSIIRAASKAGSAPMPAVYGALTIPDTLAELVDFTNVELPGTIAKALEWHEQWLAWRRGEGVGAEGVPLLSDKKNGLQNQANYPILLSPSPMRMEAAVEGLRELFFALKALRKVLQDGNLNPWFLVSKNNKEAMRLRLQGFLDAAEPILFGWDCQLSRLHGFLKLRTKAQLERMTLRDGTIHTDAAVAQLAETIGTPRGLSLLEQLQRTYRVALIDEFQDTDAVQWDIFSAVFRPESHSLLLIGDPKQAIYSFRGADIRTYLFAIDQPATRQYTFDVNYRSTAPVIDSLNELLSEKPALTTHSEWFAPEKGVRFQRVRPHGMVSSTLLGHGGVNLRWLPSRSLKQNGVRGATGLRAHVVRAVSRDLLYLLNEGIIQDVEGDPCSERKVRPGDLAILCRSNLEVKRFSEALRQKGVPVVSSSDDDLFASEEGEELLQVMYALHGSGIDSAAMRFRLGALWDEDDSQTVPQAGETPMERLAGEKERVARRIRKLQTGMRNEGMSVVLRQVVENSAKYGTLSLRHDAERALVNYLHLLEQLEILRVREHLDDVRLMHRFEESRLSSRVGNERNPVAPRLERESNAVRIMTYHKSKGLEFNVVILPVHTVQTVSGSQFRPGAVDAAPEGSSERRVEFWTHEGFSSRVDAASKPVVQQRNNDAVADSRRLDYVALTRAKSNVILYMVPFTRHSGPGPDIRLLQRCEGFGTIWEPFSKFATEPAAWDATCAAMAQASQFQGWPISVLEAVGALQNARYRDEDASRREFGGARIPQSRLYNIERVWTQPSYSSLVAGLKRRDTSLGIQRDSFRAAENSAGLVTHDDDVAQTAPGVSESPAGLDMDADLPTVVAQDVQPASLGSTDESGLPMAAPSDIADYDDSPRGLRGFMRGIAAGHALHGWFEDADFSWARNPNTWGENRGRATALLLHHMNRAQIRWPKTIGTPDEQTRYAESVCDDLYRVLQTPLTPITPAGTLDDTRGVPRLCDLSMTERMDELEFFLRAGSGMESAADSGEEELQGLVGTDWLAILAARANPDVRLSPEYQQKLCNSETDKSFRGFLNGKIDLVFRWQRRWYIVDYKSNFIARSEQEPQVSAPPSGYSLPAICAEMEHHHYYLQYHLYVLALHRYLQHRLSDYDYERDMGGVYYLFVRGMTDERYSVSPVAGEGPEVEYGIFYDRPPRSVIEGLDAVFQGRYRQEVA